MKMYLGYVALLFAVLCGHVVRGALPSLALQNCEYTAADGSYYDLSPLRITPARRFWEDHAQFTDEPPPFSSTFKRYRRAPPQSGAVKIDASVADLPYWTAFFKDTGTIVFNPCGTVQNMHGDCPSDDNGLPTNALVHLRLPPPKDDPNSVEHKQKHCVGFGQTSTLRFEDAEQANAGLRVRLSSGTSGRSAQINMVCGQSTGEITAITITGSGGKSRALVTFVSKYACPRKPNVAAADVEAERRRNKEAERKQREKLTSNLQSLQEARLLHPMPRQHKPLSATGSVEGGAAAAAAAAGASVHGGGGGRRGINSLLNNGGAGSYAAKNRAKKLKDFAQKTLKSAVDAATEADGIGAGGGVGGGGAVKASKEVDPSVDIYRQLLAKKKREHSAQQQAYGGAAYAADGGSADAIGAAATRDAAGDEEEEEIGGALLGASRAEQLRRQREVSHRRLSASGGGGGGGGATAGGELSADERRAEQRFDEDVQRAHLRERERRESELEREADADAAKRMYATGDAASDGRGDGGGLAFGGGAAVHMRDRARIGGVSGRQVVVGLLLCATAMFGLWWIRQRQAQIAKRGGGAFGKPREHQW